MLGQMTKNAQGIWASACAHALLLTGCALVALALAALPWAYGEGWTAYGVLIAAAQLAVAYTLIDRAIDSYEDRKWHNARQEFTAGLLDLSQQISYTFASYLVLGKDKDNVVFTKDGIDIPLNHIKEKSRSLDSMMAIYGHVIPPSWFEKISLLADELRATSSRAETATRNWEKILAKIECHKNMDFHWHRKHSSFIQTISINNGLKRLDSESDQDRKRTLIFGYYILFCCRDVVKITSDLKDFTMEESNSDILNGTKLLERRRSNFTEDDQRSMHEVEAYYKPIDTSSAHLLRCAKAIEESGICLVRLPQTLGSGL